MKHQSKPLLLIFPFGLLAHYLRCIVLARHLKSYFKIRFAFHPSYSHFVETEGFTSFACEGIDEATALDSAKNFDFSWLNEPALEHAFNSQVIAIEALHPIAVLGDAMPTLGMAAEFAGVQHIALINGYMSPYYAETRSLSKSHFAYNYLSKLPQFLREYLTAKGEAVAMRSVHAPFKKIRHKYGLTQKESFLEETEGDHTLICDLMSLFPQRVMPAGYTCIGPLLYENESSADSISLDKNKKTIYISMGSSGDWSHVAFLNDGIYGTYNIVAAGDMQNVLSAPHIIKSDFISVNNLFPSVDLVICHGGNGTLYQSLSYGIPVLCLPAHFEQEWNISALEKAGLAMSLDNVKQSNYRKIINEWIARKDLKQYTDLKTEVNASANQLKMVLGDLAKRVTSHTATADRNLSNV